MEASTALAEPVAEATEPALEPSPAPIPESTPTPEPVGEPTPSPAPEPAPEPLEPVSGRIMLHCGLAREVRDIRPVVVAFEKDEAVELTGLDEKTFTVRSSEIALYEQVW